jgi:hypothetical protein
MASASPFVAGESAESPGRGLADLTEDTQELEFPQVEMDEDLLPSQTHKAKAWGRLGERLRLNWSPNITVSEANVPLE